MSMVCMLFCTLQIASEEHQHKCGNSGGGVDYMGALALLQVLGAPMIPCMMMVLGAVLYKGPGTASVAPRLIIGVAFVRLLLIPLLGTAALHDPMHLLQCLLFVPQILRGQQCISCSACLLSLSVQPLMRHSIVFGCS